MKEFQDIARLLRTGPGPFVLATLCRVEGSSYRRPGARLLLDASGPLRGSLSGGCLEGDIQARAREVLDSGRPALLRYDLRGEADLVWGSGSGCEGLLEILVEPLPGPPAWMGWVEAAWAERRPVTVHTCLDEARLGVRALVDSGAWPTPGCQETFPPPIALWVVGAGDDSLPLVRMAKALGWFVGIADHRPAFPTPARFPEADGLRAAPPGTWIPAEPWDARSAALLMTHHYARDLEALRHLLRRGLGYLGLMGSRARSRRLLGELAAEGLQADDRLHTPVGLDVGSDSPETIALAVLAEIQAVMAGRTGGFLRDRAQP